MSTRVRTRIAPSPTGLFHLGTARTALFNYLFAKQQGGEFIVRIEDTDRERSKPEFETDILDGLDWLGLKSDEFYRQSERTEIYKQALEKLIKEGKAYVSPETEGESKEVIRFKNPGGAIIFTDLVHGEITFDVTDLGDFVIAKNLTEPLFHLAVVVDDAAIGISHVIRGEDHISNTPRQILIGQALGYQAPSYAHIPLILAPDRTKLSKRHGAVAVAEYRAQGYLAESLTNFLALLGWSPQAGKGTDQEVFTLADLVERFSLTAIQKSGAIFNHEKLNWLNHEHLKRLPLDLQAGYLAAGLTDATKTLPNYSEAKLLKLAPVILDRVNNFADLRKTETAGELAYFFTAPKPSKELLKDLKHLPKVIELLNNLDEQDWTAENIKNAIWDYATEAGRGEVLWPMRVALSGLPKSPDPFTLAAVLGKEETIDRLKSVC